MWHRVIWLKGTSSLEELASYIFKVEESVKYGSFPLDYMVSHPRRLQSSNFIGVRSAEERGFIETNYNTMYANKGNFWISEKSCL
jgi:hypothetical protein